MPVIVDKSPHDCDECEAVASQVMYKITKRDFKSIKKKLVEFDDYINYQNRLLKRLVEID